MLHHFEKLLKEPALQRQEDVEGEDPWVNRELYVLKTHRNLLTDQPPGIHFFLESGEKLEPVYDEPEHTLPRLLSLKLGQKPRGSVAGFDKPSSANSAGTDFLLSDILRGPSLEDLNSILSPLPATGIEVWFGRAVENDALASYAMALACRRLGGMYVSMHDALLLAWMHALANGQTSLSKAKRLQFMSQQLYQRAMEVGAMTVVGQGIPLDRFSYYPSRNRYTDELQILVEDGVHVVKNFTQQVYNQKPIASEDLPGYMQCVVGKDALIDTISSMLVKSVHVSSAGTVSGHDQLHNLRKICKGEHNSLSVAAAYNLVTCPELLAELKSRGLTATVAVMHAMGSAVIAANMYGLSRNHRAILYRQLLIAGRRLLGGMPMFASGMPSKLHGMTVGLLQAIVRSAESVMLYAEIADQQHFNILCDRALTQDAVEHLFAIIVSRFGYKPSMLQLIPAMINILRYMDFKALPATIRGFVLRDPQMTAYLFDEAEDKQKPWCIPCASVDALPPHVDLGGSEGDQVDMGSITLEKLVTWISRVVTEAGRSCRDVYTGISQRQKYQLLYPPWPGE